jgi:hypothetical protein
MPPGGSRRASHCVRMPASKSAVGRHRFSKRAGPRLGLTSWVPRCSLSEHYENENARCFPFIRLE